MPESLYTPNDIKRVRDELVKKQKGIDPILKEPFKEVPCLDHSHTTQHVRAALNRNVNAFEGLVFNAYKRCLHWLTDKPLPDILRNLATYLEQDYSNNPYHVDWMKKVATEFNKTSAKQQNAILEALGESQGGNLAERKKLLKKAILKREKGYEEIMKIIKKECQ